MLKDLNMENEHESRTTEKGNCPFDDAMLADFQRSADPYSTAGLTKI